MQTPSVMKWRESLMPLRNLSNRFTPKIAQRCKGTCGRWVPSCQLSKIFSSTREWCDTMIHLGASLALRLQITQQAGEGGLVGVVIFSLRKVADHAVKVRGILMPECFVKHTVWRLSR